MGSHKKKRRMGSQNGQNDDRPQNAQQRRISGRKGKHHNSHLPIASAKDTICRAVEQYGTTLLMGETGCGKSTQTPQYILQSDPKANIILCQPRRIAAISISARIDHELKQQWTSQQPYRSLVGFKVRFESNVTPRTKCTVCTYGILLRQLTHDSLLSGVSHVIVDEIHQRSVDSDLLLGLLRDIQRKRSSGNKPLRIILMSATVEPRLFNDFFGGKMATLYIKGRQFPITTFYASSPVQDYIAGSLFAIKHIHETAPIHQYVLVFVTGQAECVSLVTLINKWNDNSIKAFPLYSALTGADQRKAFSPVGNNTRKIVVATNVAESSLTIPKIGHVVDCGFHKERLWDPARHLSSLQVMPISRTSARQRMGRAGREYPGTCYRLYTETVFWNELDEEPLPELMRCNLATASLSLMNIGVENPIQWDGYLQKPPLSALAAALEDLCHLGAVEVAPAPRVTPLGEQMASFPLDPHLARCIIAGHRNGVLDDVLLVISMLVTDMPFVDPEQKRKKAKKAREPFRSKWGDHLRLRNVLLAYLGVQKEHKKWSVEHFLRPQAMVYAKNVYDQLWEYACKSLGAVRPNVTRDYTIENEELDSGVLRCLLVGYFSHVAILSSVHTDGTYKLCQTGQGAAGNAQVHPTSSAFTRLNPPKYILYTELSMSTKLYMRDVSPIKPEWLPRGTWASQLIK